MFRNNTALENNYVKIHFIGIGGIGMSGIAEVLIASGYNVSGSDVSESPNVKKLKKLGAEIYIGHKEENLNKVTVVVYSSAVNDLNPEVIRAKREGIPVIRRAEMLAELMRLKYGLAVAGTHGKTTTTSFLATILQECDLDPTYIIGGIVKNLDGHAKVGKGDFLVAEADESDGTFFIANTSNVSHHKY
jgi:UDP-N-acetylmuramate--alanine ligase